MLNQIEDMVIAKMVEQLNNHGINISADTLKNALSNSPQLISQLETILKTTPNTQDRIVKITTLLESVGAPPQK